MKYLFLGDTHNDLDFVESAAQFARVHDAKILQCGDWGFMWPDRDQLDELSAMLVRLGVTMRFCDGNHDDHPRLRKMIASCTATQIAPHVIYQPRGSVHEDEEGTRFLFLGGAPSIDRAGRVEGESWWPEETIASAEFDRAMKVKEPIHVLVTHDAPALPPGFTPKGSRIYQNEQALSMRYVDKLIRRHRPAIHVHGHWHVKYERRHQVGTRICGLDCNQLDSTNISDSVLLWSRDQEKS